MKKLILISLAVLLIAACKPQYDIVRKIDKENRNSPPGTVWLKDSLFIDRTEIRNINYLEYLQWLKKHDSTNYSAALLDTNVWLDKNCYNAPYVNYYLNHPAYRDYPVVGVSYEQASNFCKWRTDRVKEFIKNRSSTIEKLFGAKDFYYRLPTNEEWEYAASAGVDDQYGFENLHTKKNWPKINVKETYLLQYEGASSLTNPVISYTPNKYNLYNMIGNVAEMTMDKGVSKGGSWIHSIEDCEINKSIIYEKTESWLGFRCVCVIIK